jgi:hypothetical protein
VVFDLPAGGGRSCAAAALRSGLRGTVESEARRVTAIREAPYDIGKRLSKASGRRERADRTERDCRSMVYADRVHDVRTFSVVHRGNGS